MPWPLLALAVLTTPAVPLQPTSKWNVDYGDTACLLGRVYGTGKSETIMALRAIPLASSFDLMISTHGGNQVFRLGRAMIAIDGGRSDESGYESFPTQKSGLRVTRMPVESAIFEGIQGDIILRVTPERMPGWAFAMPNAKAAFAALAKCNDATARKWGIDPAERERIATPARALRSETMWISFHDYPPDAIRQGQQGTTVVLWTIGLDGRVGDCRTVVKSGVDSLDRTTCQVLSARGRFTPATGLDGKPMVSHQTRKVVWTLPSGWTGKRQPSAAGRRP